MCCVNVQELTEVRRYVRSSESVVIDDCELLCGYWEVNPSPL